MPAQDGRYGYRPWDEDGTGGEVYAQPSSPWEAKLVMEALDAPRLPREEESMLNRQVPDTASPRRAMAAQPSSRAALSIYDVIGAARVYPSRLNDFSGQQGGYSSSVRNSMGAL